MKLPLFATVLAVSACNSPDFVGHNARSAKTAKPSADEKIERQEPAPQGDTKASDAKSALPDGFTRALGLVGRTRGRIRAR
jgi:hypothetical protein